MNLQFDEYSDLKFFSVEFESDSRERNRLMNVIYDGFSLDIAVLRENHPCLYLKIANKMQKKARVYWDDKERETNLIPTLAYQKNAPMATKAFDAVLKASMFCIIVLFSLASFAQKDTVWVHKVKVNNRTVKVKSGYIVQVDADHWKVNNKILRLGFYKPTENPDFKPYSKDSLIASKK